MRKIREKVVNRLFSAGHSGWRWIAVGMLTVWSGSGLCYGSGVAQYWTFDEGAGSVVSNEVASGTVGDLVNFGSNGSVWDTDVPAALASRSTGSLAFNYANVSYINCGHIGLSSTQGVGEASISMWLKPESLSDMRLFGQCNATTDLPLGTVRFTPGSGDPTVGRFDALYKGDIKWYPITDYTVTTGVWHHLVVTWKGDYMVSFLNGNPVFSFLSRFDFNQDRFGQPLNFGIGAKYRGTSGKTFFGKMDDVSVWKEVLTPERIHQLASGVAPTAISLSDGPLAPVSPLAEYRLDNNTEDAQGSNDGTALGDAFFVVDAPFTYSGNMALALDGDGDSVEIADNAALRPGTKDWTISLWFKSSTAQQNVLIAKRQPSTPYTQMSLLLAGGITGSMGTADRIHTFIMGTEGSSERWEISTSGGLANNQWHHLALVRTADDWRPIVYVDGVVADIAVINTDAGTRPHNVNCTDPWYIGSWGNASNFFNGLIDEVAMWDTALTGENIAWLANNSLADIHSKGTLILIK